MRIQDVFLARISNADLRLLLRMAKTLVRDAPAKQNGPVKAALAKLIAHIAVINSAIAHRIRLANPRLIAREIEFDRALDTLWIALRINLAQTAQAFGHPGLDGLSKARKAKLEFDKLRETGDAAAAAHAQLFAANGTGFTKSSFPTQAEAMAALLRIIDEDELRASIEVAVNDQFVGALVVCQAEYEEIVDARLRRELGVAEDFRTLRHRLRFLLGRYKSAVETLYDEDQPETEAVVADALRALIIVNAHLSRSSTGQIDEALDAALEPDELGLDEELETDEEPADEVEVEPEPEPEPEVEA